MARRGHWSQTEAKVTRGKLRVVWWGKQGEGVKERRGRRRRWWRGWLVQCKGKFRGRFWEGQCCRLHLDRGWAREELLAQACLSTLQGDALLLEFMFQLGFFHVSFPPNNRSNLGSTPAVSSPRPASPASALPDQLELSGSPGKNCWAEGGRGVVEPGDPIFPQT